MLIKGKISNIQPPDFTDTYGNKYQNIQIETSQGKFTVGRIGCKKPYTQFNIGDDGQWDMEQKESSQGPYNKLKKHYDQPFQGQQPTPQNAQQGTPQAAGQANGNKEVDWDTKDLRFARENGLNNATKLICLLAEMTKNTASLNVNHVKGVASALVDYIYNGLQGEAPQTGKQMAQEFEDTMPAETQVNPGDEYAY